MKTVLFDKQGIRIEEQPRPQPGPGEVLIKTLLAGICNTDLELAKGYHGFEGVPGHEFVGLVVDAPSEPGLVGKRVAADINIGCGKCRLCLEREPHHCLDRRTIGINNWPGAFAEYLTAPAANLFVVDQRIDDRVAVFAEPLAAALQISRQINMAESRSMAVLGDGKLGLLIALALSRWNPGLVLMGKHSRKLAIAAQQGVETQRIDPDQPEAAISGQRGLFDVVVEASGSSEGIGLALKLVRPLGTVVMKTTTHEPSNFDMAKVVVDEITLVGSRCGDMGMALDFLLERPLPVESLIEARYPFKEFEAAFAHASRPGALKVLLGFEED